MKPEDCFRIQVRNDKMKATFQKLVTITEELQFLEEDVRLFLEQANIAYGVSDEVVEKLASEPFLISYPIVVAEGKRPTKGKAAYLQLVDEEEKEIDANEDGHPYMNLRNVLKIPMAEQGQVLGRKIPAQRGEDGYNVYGDQISGVNGQDFVLRNGKNTTVQTETKEIIANVNGQISIEGRRIHVYPVYEVNGDLTLETGNISFNGNVVIRGSVPSGYKVEAKGDIRITGIVEGAEIVADGSILISQGIASQGKGKVIAGYDVHCGYINQGNVTAGNNVKVTQSIIHSVVDAGHSLICNGGKGNIIGGKNSAGRRIQVREAGNHLNTPTELYIGISEQRLRKEQTAKETIKQGKEELIKLQKLKQAMLQKEKVTGSLSVQDRVVHLRIRNTIENWITQVHLASDVIKQIEEQNTVHDSVMIIVEKRTHMNTVAHFGKYKRSVTKNRQSVTFKLIDGEIVLQ